MRHLPRSSVPVLLAVGLGLTGCGADGAADSASGDLSGPDRPVSVERTPVWQIGGVDAPDWAAFGEVSDLAFDGRGNLHVLDGLAGRITVVDPNGALVRTYGTPGEGPGEIRAPGPLVVRSDGSAALYDYGHGAWMQYDELGSFTGSVRLEGEGAEAPGEVAFSGPAATVVAPGTGTVETADRWVWPVRRYGLDSVGAGAETIFGARALPPPPPPVVDQVSLGGSTITVRIPRERGFEPGLHLAVLADGRMAVADTFTWRVEIRGPDGAVERVLERPIDPLPVTEALREAERARRLAAVADGELPGFMISSRSGEMSPADRGSVREFMEARLENMVFTEQVPVLEGLLVDSRGILWVVRNAGEPGVPGPIDLVTPDGGYLGTLPTGEMAEPRAFGPDALAAWVESDDLGILRIRVERLSGPDTGARP